MSAPQKRASEELINEIADDLIIYLKDGKLAPNSFIKKLNLNINNLLQLIKVHFILQPKVKEFVAALPYRLRNIKTSTKMLTKFLRGEVRGRVNWQKTLKQRTKGNYYQDNTFVCQQLDKNFNITENVVLKRFLGLLHNILFNDLKIQNKNYSWLSNWLGDKELAAELEQIYSRNIYLKRIKHNQIKITERMIVDTAKSRNVLYQEAAELLGEYRQLTNINNLTGNGKEKLKEILADTFIRPTNEDVLFELYWVIRLINNLTTKPKFNLVDGSGSIVASWEEGKKEYQLYHDAAGSKELKWGIDLSEVEESKDDYLQRRVASKKVSQNLAEKIFGQEISSSYWSGRPDIVIEVRNKKSKQLEKVIIGEIKYTIQWPTIKSGMQELIDYLGLIKKDAQYLANSNLDKYQVEVEGLLLFDGFKQNGKNIEAIKLVNCQGEWEEVINPYF